MRPTTISQAVIFLASIILVDGQLSTKCNPLSGACPANPALGKTVFYDFTQGPQPGWTADDGTNPSYEPDGVHFNVVDSGQILVSDNYIFFGSVIAYVKSTKGKGIVSSVILASDDRDEIDWEWLGADNANAQTNYFGGRSINGGNSEPYAVERAQDEFHKYEIQWAKEAIEWLIDDITVRRVTYEEAQNGLVFPQTPSQIRMGAWIGCASQSCLLYGQGDKSQPACDTGGTCVWAQGYIGEDAGPYDMVIANVTFQDASCGVEYSYTNRNGTWQSIEGTTACGDTSTSTAVPTGTGSSISSTSSIPTTTTSPISTTTPYNSHPGGVNATMTTSYPTGSSVVTTISTTTAGSTITDAITITDSTTIATGTTISQSSTTIYTTTIISSTSIMIGPTIENGKTMGTATSSIVDGTSFIASSTVTDGTTTSVTQTIIDGSTVSPSSSPGVHDGGDGQRPLNNNYNFIINNGHHGPTPDGRTGVDDGCGCKDIVTTGSDNNNASSSTAPTEGNGSISSIAGPSDSNSPSGNPSGGNDSSTGNPSGANASPTGSPTNNNDNNNDNTSPDSTTSGSSPNPSNGASGQGLLQVSSGVALRLKEVRFLGGVGFVLMAAFLGVGLVVAL